MNKNITSNVRALHYECVAGRMPLCNVQPWTLLASALLLLVEAVSHYEASLALTFYLIELLYSAACLLLSTSSLREC